MLHAVITRDGLEAGKKKEWVFKVSECGEIRSCISDIMGKDVDYKETWIENAALWCTIASEGDAYSFPNGHIRIRR